MHADVLCFEMLIDGALSGFGIAQSGKAVGKIAG